MNRFQFLFNEDDDTGGGGGGGGGDDQQQQQQQSSSQSLITPSSSQQQSQQQAPPPGQKQQAGGSFKFHDLLDDTGNFKPDWVKNLPEGLREHADHFSKYKTPLHALEHTRNLQQLLGKKQNAVVIPTDPNAPKEEWDPVLRKLGVPETPDGYGLKVPADLPEGIQVDEAQLKEFATFAHGIGLTPAQVAKLQEFDLQRATRQVEGSAAQALEIETRIFQEQKAMLDKAWGTGPESVKKRELAERAALVCGFSAEDMKNDPLFRNAKFVMAMARAGEMMSEDTLPQGSDIGAPSSNKAKAQDIISNPSNPLYKRYWDGDETIVGQVRALMRS